MTKAEQTIEKSAFQNNINTSNSKTFRLLPCLIKMDGEAPFDTYFIEEVDPGRKLKEDRLERSVKEDIIASKPKYTSTLRGRGLQGTDLIIPDYAAVLLSKSDDEWKVLAKAERLTVWAHDEEPTIYNNSILNAPAWIQLSEAIHKNV